MSDFVLLDSYLNNNLNEVLNVLNPNMQQCTECKKWVDKKIFILFYDSSDYHTQICPLCVKKQEEELKIKEKEIQHFMVDFNDRYQKDKNFILKT